MDLTTLRQVAKGRYGLTRDASEDALFTNGVLNDIINEKHRWFAATALCYYDHSRFEALAADQSAYAADADVIEIDTKTVRLLYGADTYTILPLRLYPSLVQQYGPLESVQAAVPTCFWMRAGGSANDESRIIELLPKPAAAASANHRVYYGAWVYPATLSSDSDRPKLPASEHDRLIPAICWGMAELEAARGRNDAPVRYWEEQAISQATELHEIIRRGTREAVRTAQVGRAPIDDAIERRQAKLAPLQRGQG